MLVLLKRIPPTVLLRCIRQHLFPLAERPLCLSSAKKPVKSGLTVLVGRATKNEKNGDGLIGSQRAWLGVFECSISSSSLKWVSVTLDAAAVPA